MPTGLLCAEDRATLETIVERLEMELEANDHIWRMFLRTGRREITWREDGRFPQTYHREECLEWREKATREVENARAELEADAVAQAACPKPQ